MEAREAILTSGTLASLTGYRDYATLDSIQEKFMNFVQESTKNYRTWQEAWREFWGK